MGQPLTAAVCFLCVLSALPAQAAAPPAERVDFNRDIRPILSNHCYACHGPDKARRKARLRLDQKDSAFHKLRGGGFALVPGSLDKSELWARVSSDEETEQMPPPRFGKPLSKAQIDLLRRWIEQGAEWKPHWAYVPPRRPPLPAVRDTSWPRNGIDYFILARLEREGLRPAPEADRATLLRRVTFDLTGLPPTPAELDAFLADQSPHAYEKVVDRLLASPHYGERMAQHWLDLARYADTNGYHIDNHRDMWKWRDWVINAFNRDMPFDQFTIEQLAGDLLPNPTLDQKIATGFNRNHMINFEGGADPDEYHTYYVVDRVTTTATVWLGSTLACTQCHDHKYDPFTQKEFYQFYAFFNNVPEKGLDGQKENPVPSLKVPTPEYQAQKAALARKRLALEDRIRRELARVQDTPGCAALHPGLYSSTPQGFRNESLAILQPPRGESIEPRVERSATRGVHPGPHDQVWVDDDLPAGALPQGQEGPASWKWVTRPRSPVLSGERAHTRTARGLSQHFFTGASEPLHIGPGDRLFTHVYLDPRDPPREIMLQFHDGSSWDHRAYWGANLIDWGTDHSPSRLDQGLLPPAGQWVRLEVDPRAVGLADGAAVNGMAFTQFDGTVYWDRAGLFTEHPAAASSFTSLGSWEQWQKVHPDAKLPQRVRDLLRIEPGKRSEAQKAKLRTYFVRHVHAGARVTFEPLNKEEEALKKAEADLEKEQPSVMVMQEMNRPRDTFVLLRGDFQQKGEKVTAGVPGVLPPLPQGARADRLGLARWLVMPGQPLTARVTVNRYWEQLFGAGIVKTGEDFGSQGDWPSHPELLDWLAVEFTDPSPQPSPQRGEGARGEPSLQRGEGATGSPSPRWGEGRVRGWNVKAFQKMLVLSATYRQSSRVTPELLQKDPENRLLARGPRFRLPAEMIRDNALAVSGLLNREQGGPSVKPYQPPGLWEQVAFGGGFSAQTYVQSHGPDLYRRGLYTYWKRSLPHPSLVTFDAPNREVCTERRPRTNTPLQALVLLNDPIYVECARALGQRVLREGGPDTPSRLRYAFRLCTGRAPTDSELAVLSRIYQRQAARFHKDQAAALKLLQVGESPRPAGVDACELAAWTAIGNVLLNLDETITRG